MLDYDADGVLDARDMWYFYEELQSRLEAMGEEQTHTQCTPTPSHTFSHLLAPSHAFSHLLTGEELVPFDELVNEIMDMVSPRTRGRIRLSELRRCGLGFNIVSALTNVRKYIAWEGLSCEKAAGRASNLRDTRDWDLFADAEYRCPSFLPSFLPSIQVSANPDPDPDPHPNPNWGLFADAEYRRLVESEDDDGGGGAAEAAGDAAAEAASSADEGGEADGGDGGGDGAAGEVAPAAEGEAADGAAAV